ncbi:hypothetical protein BDZ94DRAFT_1354558 [Collybia nuda]|uniref:Carbohydrate esterase family 16 protein n=1 Tax=Collybia nuda TaxID=64659 RepID=A0A9P5XS18_9AGAR|nr:hypothetical protein BDZ94DRAFT_1354558 [Collybia nuda]
MKYTHTQALLLLSSCFCATSLASIISDARYVFAFSCSSSYTTEGWTGIGNPLIPYNKTCSTAGPNWIQQLVGIAGNSELIDLAVNGATADQDIVFTAPPDFRNQTAAFLSWIAPPPDQVPWTGDNSLFLVTFGTNDIVRSFFNSTGNGTDLHVKIFESYFNTVDKLYLAGARRFVFNNVIPFDRAGRGIDQGPVLQEKMKFNILDINFRLSVKANAYCASKKDIICTVFDAHSLFTHMMDNFKTLGFMSPDAFCNDYAEVHSCEAPGVAPACLGPISSYIWKNGLHPSWAADTLWAKALYGQLSGIQSS